jgi:hypothetical protein
VLPPWQWAALVRDLTEARDMRAVDGALIELEFAVRGIDDRDEVRRALANAGWATGVINRHIPFDLRDAVFDRLAAIAFGATGPSRATPGARADARRLAAEADSVDLIRAIVRAGAERDVADVLAKRWLAEHAPMPPDREHGPVGRLVRRHAFLVTLAMVVTFALGGLVGGVIW